MKGLCPDHPHHNVDILFLERVTVHSIGTPYCTKDADAGSNDANHRCDCMERDRKPFLEFGDNLRDRHRFYLQKEPEHFTPDTGLIPREIGSEAVLNDSLDLLWRSHTFTLASSKYIYIAFYCCANIVK